VVLALVVVDGRAFGGAQVYARSLVRHAPAGWRVDVAVTADHARHVAAVVDVRAGRVHVVPTSIGRDVAPELESLVRRLSPDLVQVNLVDPASMLAALDAAQRVAPTVATLHMHGDVADRARIRRSYDRLRHVVAVSRQAATTASALMPPERVSVVRNGVDPVDAGPPPAGPVPVIGSLGRLTPQKGFDVLVDAVRLLVARGRSVEVRVAGEGREAVALRGRAADLPISFVGFLDGPAALLGDVDVFCLPSRAEGLPLALLEAVSAGRPAVATDVGDVRSVLGDVVTVVPPDDPAALAGALAQLLDHPRAAAHRAERGRALSRGALSAEQMAGRTWETFGRAAGLPPARCPG
jgi:glycosyltransferase involved in cell wall biosynthesis